jgi:hypothetical protein
MSTLIIYNSVLVHFCKSVKFVHNNKSCNYKTSFCAFNHMRLPSDEIVLDMDHFMLCTVYSFLITVRLRARKETGRQNIFVTYRPFHTLPIVSLKISCFLPLFVVYDFMYFLTLMRFLLSLGVHFHILFGHNISGLLPASCWFLAWLLQI